MIYLICRWFNELFAPAPFSSRFFPPTFLLQAIHFHCGMSTAILWMNIFFLVWWPLPAIACIKCRSWPCLELPSKLRLEHGRPSSSPVWVNAHAHAQPRPALLSPLFESGFSFLWLASMKRANFQWNVSASCVVCPFFRLLWVLSACLILIPLFFLICCMFSVGFMTFVLSWHFSSPFVCLP